MAAYDPQAEAMLQQAVVQTIAPIAHMSKQYSAEQIQKMILDYAGRAAKRKASGKAWREVASDFTYSFFESLWKVFGESEWLDQVDFTWIVGAAFRAYLPRPEMASVSDQEFNEFFARETALGLDCSRYYSWSAYVLKKIISGKASQKKVRDAVDNCREELLKQNLETAEQFVTAWIEGSIGALGKDVEYNLPQSTAVHLFECYVREGGGIPLWLMNAATDSVIQQVGTTISTVYSSIPGASGEGTGKGSSKSYGAAAVDPFMGQQWGGLFAGGKGYASLLGYSPY
jgi:hypothetical protein